jgi:spore germination protein GerM
MRNFHFWAPSSAGLFKTAVSNVMRLLVAAPVVLAVASFTTSCGFERTVLSSRDVHSQVVEQQPSQPAQIRVWFVKNRNDSLQLVPVVRDTTEVDRLKDSINELLRGPSPEEESDGLLSEIPRGTVLIDVKDNGEDIELNLSRRFSSGGGTSLDTRLQQLSKTVTEVVGKKRVYLDIEGERLTTAGGDGLEIKQPIN